MHRGYVKVWRKIEDSGLMQLPNTLALFMFILLSATHKDRKLGSPNGVIDLKPGQWVSGRKELASKLKQTEQQIRTGLERLEKLGILTIQSTNRFSIYTIENYSIYQSKDESNNQQSNHQATNKQPTDNQQATTKQEFKHLSTEEKSSHALACPFEELINAYHVNMPSNPRCKVLNDARKKMIKARWDEASKLDHLPFGYKTIQEGITAWNSFFRICNTSELLTGQVSRLERAPWIADIDFLFSPSGFAKCLENKYHRAAA
jgi:hypothetical protein